MPCLKRYLVIAIMLVLLPLRGWAGDTMAVSMASATAAKASLGSQAAMTADCAMHMPTAADETASVCGNCDTCELCLAVANLSPAFWSANGMERHVSPAASSASFRSATKSSNLKPPII